MSVDIPESDEALGLEGAPVDLRAPWRLTCARIEHWVALVAEVPAVIILVAEVAVLFIGVIFRYGLNHSLVWTDELSGMLFLWLSMLGMVSAQHRVGHLHLAAVAVRLPAVWRNRLKTLAASIAALFVLEIVLPATRYAIAQWDIITAALSIHDTVRASAIVVGAVLLLIVALLQMAQRATLKDIGICFSALALCAAALWFAQPWLEDIGNWNLVIFFGFLVPLLVLSGTPIAFSFGVATMTYLGLMTHVPLTIVISRMDEGMSTLVLLAIPLFIFLGLLIEMTGLAARLVAFLAALVGHFRGGLSYTLVGAMYLVSGISGSKAADMAAIAPVLLPEMRRRGQPPGELIGILSSSAAMGETIPPSIVLITVGSVTGVSIAGLFTGGLLPAVVGSVGLILVTYWRSRAEVVSQVKRASGRQIGRAFIAAVPALILPILIRWAVVAGVTTATEVSTTGVVYTIIVALVVYRQSDWSRLPAILLETVSLTGTIMVILGAATAMGWALTQSGFSADLAAAMSRMPGGGAGFLALSIPVFAILGSVLEGIPAVVLFGPLLFPIAAELHINLVHYGIVVVLSMSLGLFTPPFGIGFYQACAIGRVEPDQAMRTIWPFMAALLVATILVAALPVLTVLHF
jgi:tripartite ATP-independent transporter DctM subunit